MEFIAFGIAVGFPWNALLSSNTFYEEHLPESTSLAELESALTFTYFGMNLLAFAWLHRSMGGHEHTGYSSSNTYYISSFFYVNLAAFSLLSISPLLIQVLAFVRIFPLVLLVGGLLGGTSAFYQHAMFALCASASKGNDGAKATGNFVFGFALAGFLASLCGLLTRNIVSANVTAVLNFGMTLVSLLLALALFLKHRHRPEEEAEQDQHVLVLAEGEFVPTPATGIGLYLSVLGIVMSSTLVVFPAVISLIQPTSSTEMDPAQFTSILFVLFNLGDLLGRGIAAATRAMSWASPTTLLLASLVRTASLLLCFATNRDKGGNAALLGDTVVYLLVLYIGVSGGILFAAAASRASDAMPNARARAGQLVAVTIAVSLALGALLGALVVALI